MQQTLYGDGHTLSLYQLGQLLLSHRSKWPLRLKMWLVSVGDGTFHLVSHLFINEIKDSYGAMMIAKDRSTVKVEETMA